MEQFTSQDSIFNCLNNDTSHKQDDALSGLRHKKKTTRYTNYNIPKHINMRWYPTLEAKL